MGKVKVKAKQRQDKYYYLAKEQGYRSRASFKLIQLHSKYMFLSSARSVLDLCAAPGGWLQVAVRLAPVGAFIVGVDLFPILPIRGAHSLIEDITTPKCRAAIKRLMDANGCSVFDVVLHDGSPNVGGAWAQEATSQSSLVVDSLRLATSFLAPKGTFVTKVFRSQDYSAVVYCIKQLFEKVEVTKPAASRSTSAEIYVVGKGYKAPAKIDPRLLDIKHLFQGALEQPKVVDVLRGSKQKRNREGYDEGNPTLWKVGLGSDFVWSESPLEFLGSVNAISFDDPACLAIRDHELTTDEVKSLCEDLYVLDKNGFKHLLKWRVRIRKALSVKQKDETKSPVAEDKKTGNDDDRLLNEMEELTHILDHKKRKAKKLIAKRRAKDKARKALGSQADATEDGYFDRDLFSLSAIKGKKDLQAVEEPELNEEDIVDGFRDSDDDTHMEVGHKESESDIDSDEEQKRYDKQLEEMLDEAYERYVTRKGGSTTQRKRAKVKSTEGDDLLEDGADEDLVQSDNDFDQGCSQKEINPLMVHLNDDEQPSQEEIIQRWFSQDVFTEAAEQGMLEGSESEEEKPKLQNKSKKSKEKLSQPKAKDSQPIDANNVKTRIATEEDFEVVPAEPVNNSSSDSSSSDESEEEDDYTKAEILAYAKKMLRKKQREQILDDAYNKYMFDDEGLPTWFLEEEMKHRQPIKPVTKEEVAAMRAQFREIDARPAKKVAQAKARKKRDAMKKLEKVRRKANTIADQTDISERSKTKMIEQLYKKATPKKPKKEYVVAKKGVQIKAGKGKVIVDRRMKKDMRSRGSGKAGKKGKGRGGKGKGQGKGNQGKKSSKSFGKSAGKGH